LRDHRKLEGDGFTRETFTLPLEQARKKARDILNEYAVGGYATVVENWRQLPDGQIEFTMRRLFCLPRRPKADCVRGKAGTETPAPNRLDMPAAVSQRSSQPRRENDLRR